MLKLRPSRHPANIATTSITTTTTKKTPATGPAGHWSRLLCCASLVAAHVHEVFENVQLHIELTQRKKAQEGAGCGLSKYREQVAAEQQGSEQKGVPRLGQPPTWLNSTTRWPRLFSFFSSRSRTSILPLAWTMSSPARKGGQGRTWRQGPRHWGAAGDVLHAYVRAGQCLACLTRPSIKVWLRPGEQVPAKSWEDGRHKSRGRHRLAGSAAARAQLGPSKRSGAGGPSPLPQLHARVVAALPQLLHKHHELLPAVLVGIVLNPSRTRAGSEVN